MQELIGLALKADDKVRLSTLRMLESAFNYERIAKQHVLTADEEIDVIKREAKKRKDAIEAYSKVTGEGIGRAKEKRENEEKELKVLEEYLPKQLSDEELAKMVDDAIKTTSASQMSDMGKVIGIVMGKAKGSVEGGRVSQMVKTKLLKQ
ncbi:MAG TPA: GatB/YqeY domain-containing protein [Patescibacteria group bacterium]